MLTMYLACVVGAAWLLTACSLAQALGNGQSFHYEKLQNFGLGKRVIPGYRRVNEAYAYPAPLRAKTPAYIRPPYRSIYQGVRRKGDQRVYIKRFDYVPKSTGHRVFCHALTDCKIVHMAIETAAGTPVLLRGGAGHTYFSVVIKADAGVPLQGTLKAYCRKEHAAY